MKLDVKCTENGDYAPLQCFPGNKFCYCALPDGTQVTQPSRNRKFCACDLLKYDADKKLNINGRPIDRKSTNKSIGKNNEFKFKIDTAPSGTWVPKCQRDGLFYAKQCEAGTNVCWCVNQDGAQTSKDKKVGITCS